MYGGAVARRQIAGPDGSTASAGNAIAMRSAPLAALVFLAAAGSLPPEAVIPGAGLFGPATGAQAQASREAAFQKWLKEFAARARKEGISARTIRAAFKGVKYNARVIELDNYQPECVKPIGDYITRRTTPQDIQRGRQQMRKYRSYFARLGRAYGVQPEYVVAIWRLESNYGANFGTFDVIEALATLAFDGRRKGFWSSELIEALRILQAGHVSRRKLVGSWAGAMGHTQFIPSSYRRRAVDYDGDGRKNLWSVQDALASTANYLKKAGWQPGVPFGWEVKLPRNFPYELATKSVTRPLSAWRALGVTLRDGKPLPDYAGSTSIILPSGYKGPAFLVTGNYRAILRYNNADAYALTVALVAERLRGGGVVVTPWPLSDRLLTRTEKEELQRLLARQGFDPGPVDGKVGSKTRAAIRDFQKKQRVPADGYANFALLERARKAAGVTGAR